MTKPHRTAAVTILLVGCASVGGDSATFAGLWGGKAVEIRAASDSLILNGYCYLVVFRGPTVLTSADSFAITGQVTASSSHPEVGQPWRLYGVVVADTLTLTEFHLKLGTADEWIGPVKQRLFANQGGDFSQVQCTVIP